MKMNSHDIYKPSAGSRGLIGILLVALLQAYSSAQTVEWVRQSGTIFNDLSWEVSADGLGNVYISGITKGSFDGTNAGSFDAFVSKFDDAGTLLWSRQLGTPSDDRSYGVSADGLGNVYVSGFTEGSLEGTNAGSYDAFISKYDSLGTLLWTNQFGTSSIDKSFGVSADGLGNVYVSGVSRGDLGGAALGKDDVFLAKYDGAGTLLWSEKLGTDETEENWGVSADGLGNVYVSGNTAGSLNGTSPSSHGAYVAKFDSLGTLLWTQQIGDDSPEGSLDVSADGLGNVYISGTTQGSLGGINAGGEDAYISKFDSSGAHLWTQQLGSASTDIGHGVSADGLGNVYVGGWTRGAVGETLFGQIDVFVSKFDANGTLVWTEQLGTSGNEGGRDVSADGLGNIYFTGDTSSSFGGRQGSFGNAFLGKISDSVVPEPSTFFSLIAGLLMLCLRRQRLLW